MVNLYVFSVRTTYIHTRTPITVCPEIPTVVVD